MVDRRQNHSFQVSQFYLLLSILFVSYVGFILWLGIRWIVLLSGAVIVGVTIAYWQKSPRKSACSIANLLQAEVFLERLCLLDDRVSDASKTDASKTQWRSIRQQAQTIQQIAAQLAQQEPAFIPDLLETLHSVLALVEQLVQALQVKQQVQAPHYQKLAQQQVQNSLDRLQQTHDQLQTLRDQIALGALKGHSFNAVVSKNLRTFTAESDISEN